MQHVHISFCTRLGDLDWKDGVALYRLYLMIFAPVHVWLAGDTSRVEYCVWLVLVDEREDVFLAIDSFVCERSVRPHFRRAGADVAFADDEDVHRCSYKRDK